MESKEITKLKEELFELKTRAKQIGYKNFPPTFPEPKRIGESIQARLVGFKMRFHNWKQGLWILENPGGIPNSNSQENITTQKVGDSLSNLLSLNNSLNKNS